MQSVPVCGAAKPAAVTGLAFSPVTASLVATCSGARAARPACLPCLPACLPVLQLALQCCQAAPPHPPAARPPARPPAADNTIAVLRSPHPPGEPQPEDAPPAYTLAYSALLTASPSSPPVAPGYRVQLAMHPTREQFAVLQSSVLAVYSIAGLQRVAVWAPGPTNRLTAATYTPDGHHLLVAFTVRAGPCPALPWRARAPSWPAAACGRAAPAPPPWQLQRRPPAGPRCSQLCPCAPACLHPTSTRPPTPPPLPPLQNGFIAVLDATTLDIVLELSPELCKAQLKGRHHVLSAFVTAISCTGAAASGNLLLAIGINSGAVKVGCRGCWGWRCGRPRRGAASCGCSSARGPALPPLFLCAWHAPPCHPARRLPPLSPPSPLDGPPAPHAPARPPAAAGAQAPGAGAAGGGPARGAARAAPRARAARVRAPGPAAAQGAGGCSGMMLRSFQEHQPTPGHRAAGGTAGLQQG